MAKLTKSNAGRPKIEVNEELLEKLAKLHLSHKVMAEIVGISVDTLDRNFADKIDLWQSESKSKIASVLFDEAINKREPWALKALAQKHLDYSDKIKTEQDITLNLLADKMAKARIRAGKE